MSSAGEEAVELAAMAGLNLDPWQQFGLHNALGERADGKWAAFEVGVEVPRQNGKGGMLEARELAGLFLLGERLIIHSAHEFATASEALERMDQILEGCPDLSRRVRAFKRSHGEEGVYLKSGQRLRYKTRTKGGGRGFSADCVVLDEAMIIPESFLGALMPTLSARPNPQLFYTGSAVDQEHMEHGIVFARLRERALAGNDPSLAYIGWSADAETPDDVTDEMATDPEVWAQANPALGIRIAAEHIAKEQRSMDRRTFAVERLGVGDWPSTDPESAWVIARETWQGCADVDSKALDPIALCFDVTPDRSYGSIGIGALGQEGERHTELVDRRRGTGWIVERVVDIIGRHEVSKIVCDGAGPAGSLIEPLQKALAAAGLDVEVEALTSKEHGQACGTFFDLCAQDRLRHLDQDELNAALKGAAMRPLGDAWAWSRKNSTVDISPLVACTLATWAAGLETTEKEPLFAWA